jgi:general secretion pathway protein A
MYAEFYGLREPPFNITPDPRFLYLNDCYQEALAALAYGIDARKGFISLIGEAGTGKTTLLRRVLDTVQPSTRTVLLLNPTVTFPEILDHILSELGIPTEGGGKLAQLQRLNEFLLEHTRAGGNVALLIDEAQDLSPSVLEELRLLSNLETAREKILQIVLAGQPELDAILADPGLRQLRQRVTLRVRLRPLSEEEVAAYVNARLEYAGAARRDIFAPGTLPRVASFSHGIPRLVNVLCDAALLTAFAAGNPQVTAEVVDETCRDYGHEAPVAVSVVQPAPREAAPAEPAPPPPAPAAAAQPAAPVPPPSFRVRPALEAASPPPPPASSPTRSTLSVPAAAALVVVLGAGLYTVSLSRMRLDELTPPFPVAEGEELALIAEEPATPTAIVAEEPAPTAAEAAPPAEQPAVAAPEPAAPSAQPVAATEPPKPAAVEPVAAAAEKSPAPADPVPVNDGALSSIEVATVIEQFRAAYEARDAERLLGLFAPDAAENGRRGLDAIGAQYRDRLGALEQVRYSVPSMAVEARGLRADARTPFVITYTQRGGATGEVRGQAEWEIERRDGRARIIQLNYRLDGES